jgi:hypothetical protein
MELPPFAHVIRSASGERAYVYRGRNLIHRDTQWGYPAFSAERLMAGKKKYSPHNWYSVAIGRGQKCPYCCGRNGEAKDIYMTQEDAGYAARRIENECGIPLKAYPCPQSTGWHLTKREPGDADSCEMDTLGGNPDIPKKSSKPGTVSWEYESTPMPDNKSLAQKPPKKQPPVPIVKITCKTGTEHLSLSGKITEVVENIDAAAYFGINEDNPFAAALIKELLNKPLIQITVHTALKTGQTGSFTILIDRPLFKQHHMAKGGTVTLAIKAKIVNNKKAWYCTLPADKHK